jgi:hypothetical protein
MAQIDFTKFNQQAESNNKVGVLESMLAGVGSGLISIPKGFFSLGASLLDLGVDSGKAARVEAWFDDLTDLDEKAEATAAGKITELLVNIGIPGGLAFKGAGNLAKSAMLASKNNKYVKLNNPKLVNAADEALELTAKGKGRQFMAGAIGGGVAEGVFVGDVEQAGSFGDLLGGPTGINRDDDGAVTEILNRVKFGTEGALFTGILGGAGTVIKKITNRNKKLDVANSKLDYWIDKIASGLRARSGKSQEFFDEERLLTGERAADGNIARNISRDIELNIDAIFPSVRTMLNKNTLGKDRNIFLKEINDLLFSGTPSIDPVSGVTTFGKMSDRQLLKVENTIRKYQTSKAKGDVVLKNIYEQVDEIRTKFSDMFSKLGRTLSKEELAEFQTLFGGKFKEYLGTTYDIFQNKSILPFMGYRPAAQQIEEAKSVFISSAKEAGKDITDLEAEQIVARVLDTASYPKAFRIDRPSEAIFNVPEFFVNRTVIGELATARGSSIANISQLSPEVKEVFNRLLGKNKNPMQSILAGMSKLSMITQRNIFFRNLLTKSDELKASGKPGMFYKTEEEAIANFGKDIQKVRLDEAQKLNVGTSSGSINPLEGMYTTKAQAEALEGAATGINSKNSLGALYNSLVLYPKATSQIAKTILSPVTHLRNFVSAGAFATANGIIPDGEAIKQAYQALQTPLKGTRMQNDLYQKLLRLGVVNSNVRLGDLSRLMEDVNFGSTMTSDKGLRLLAKPLAKLKSVSQDLYTAEDDFWKIASWAMESKRLEKSFQNIGITRGQFFKKADGTEVKLTQEYLEKEAADIVKNNIPNYDYVSDFVKNLRALPIGNFVSFPAEIARTGTNIVSRALREINEEIIVNGKTYKPFQSIGYTRLFGFGTTVAAVPAGTVAAFQAIYNITEDEREAIRRYAAQWSKNSTLLPIRTEDGGFKYIDFSHANAYDTLLRPIQTVINSVADGRTDQDGMMDDFAKGMFTAMKEFGEPFMSESIWTEAVLDIIARGGRTREGFQVYNPEDNAGDKNSKIFSHLVKAQMPFSLNQLKRLDRSIESVDVITKGKYDEYGQDFEFGDEFQGLFGFRSINVNPERTLRYKVADFQRGSRDSRSLFTRMTLKGGPLEPREVVDAYINANRALFGVKKDLKLDMDAARTLNIGASEFTSATDRISNIEKSSIDNNQFRPISISMDVRKAFADNAAKIGASNPYEEAAPVINQIEGELANISLEEPELPFIENPLLPTAEENTVTGPNTLNLPGIDQQIMSQSQAAGQFSNLTMNQKIRLLFPNG